MTFNTGNNVPSTDPRDLYDNAENLDKLVNGADPFYADRKGVLRESWAGMKNTFDTSQTGRETAFALSQADKESRFQAFLVSSGYVSKGDYAANVVLAERNEYVAVNAATTGASPGLYRPNASATLPLTLTGTWATDSANLVLLGDDVLRQELASSVGAAMIGAAAQVVPSISELRGLLRTSPSKSAFVTGYSAQGDGGGGPYYLDAADTTSADNGGTVIVATDGGRWKLEYKGSVGLEQFGAVGTELHDDAVSRAIAWAESSSIVSEAANAKLTFGAGKTLNLQQSHEITVPIQMEVLSMVHDSGSSGACFVIGATYSARNTGWSLKFPAGARCVTGNTELPTSVNAAGRGFMEVRRMQFSEIEIGTLIAYPNHGLYLNGSENVFVNQHVQHNRITLGQIAYNGVGLKLLSNSAETGGVQANDIRIQDVFSNFHNMEFDTDGYSNSTSNLVTVQAMDLHAPGGYGLNCYSSFNRFEFGFVESSLLFQATSFYNVVRCGNNQSSGIQISDVGTSNWILTGPPSTTQLPATIGPELEVVRRNNFGVPIVVYGTATLTPTSDSSQTLAIHVGPASSPGEVMKCAVGAMTNPNVMQFPFSFIVKPGDYYKLSVSGTGTASISNLYVTQSSV